MNRSAHQKLLKHLNLIQKLLRTEIAIKSQPERYRHEHAKDDFIESKRSKFFVK